MTKSNESSEIDIQNEILDWLNQNGIFAFRVNNGAVYDSTTVAYRNRGKFSLKGVSDILGVMPDGRLLAIEVKTKTGRVSAEQNAFVKKITSRNGIGIIARSLDDVKARLT
jgi:hypothetical protein